MAGFSAMDKNKSYLLEVRLILNTIFPPSYAFTLMPVQNGKPSRTKDSGAITVFADIHQGELLASNLMNPGQYGPIVAKHGKNAGNVGRRDGGSFYVGSNSQYGLAYFDEEVFRSLAAYVMACFHNAGITKDLLESLHERLAQAFHEAGFGNVKTYFDSRNGQQQSNGNGNQQQQAPMGGMPPMGGNQQAPMGGMSGMPPMGGMTPMAGGSVPGAATVTPPMPGMQGAPGGLPADGPADMSAVANLLGSTFPGSGFNM